MKKIDDIIAKNLKQFSTKFSWTYETWNKEMSKYLAMDKEEFEFEYTQLMLFIDYHKNKLSNEDAVYVIPLLTMYLTIAIFLFDSTLQTDIGGLLMRIYCVLIIVTIPIAAYFLFAWNNKTADMLMKAQIQIELMNIARKEKQELVE